MSLTTSCPTCGTVFRVVPDQLKLSDGWVRCGHCEEVFDANAHLAQEAAPLPVAPRRPEPPPPSPSPSPSPDYSGPGTIGPAPSVVYRRHDEETEAVAPLQDAGADVPAPAAFVESLPPPEPAAEPAWAQPREEAPPAAPQADARARAYASAAAIVPDDDDLDDLTFVRRARRRAFWRRPLVRALLLLASLLLGALLLLQWAWVDRDRLAARHPHLLPLLQQMCAVGGCRLRPPRQIESVVIESSSFDRVRGDAFQLAVALRNTAGIALEMPALELTLTDGQDQPVLRRVLTPADLGAPGQLPPKGEWSATVGLTVPGNGTARIMGYHVLAFYP